MTTYQSFAPGLGPSRLEPSSWFFFENAFLFLRCHHHSFVSVKERGGGGGIIIIITHRHTIITPVSHHHRTGASLAAAAAKAKSAVAVAGPIPFVPFTHNQILRAVNLGSLPAWFSMVLLPRWRHTKNITLAVAVAYALLYATLACVLFSESVLSLDFKTLTTAEGVTKVFSDSTAVLAGWAHFIVFDLFTARFFLQDSARVGIPHLAVVPCILGCMFFGPVGLLMYLLVKKRTIIRDEEGGGAVKTFSF